MPAASTRRAQCASYRHHRDALAVALHATTSGTYFFRCPSNLRQAAGRSRVKHDRSARQRPQVHSRALMTSEASPGRDHARRAVSSFSPAVDEHGPLTQLGRRPHVVYWLAPTWIVSRDRAAPLGEHPQCPGRVCTAAVFCRDEEVGLDAQLREDEAMRSRSTFERIAIFRPRPELR